MEKNFKYLIESNEAFTIEGLILAIKQKLDKDKAEFEKASQALKMGFEKNNAFV